MSLYMATYADDTAILCAKNYPNKTINIQPIKIIFLTLSIKLTTG